MNDRSNASEPDPDISPDEFARNGLSEFKNGLLGEGSREGRDFLAIGFGALWGVEWRVDEKIG